MNHLLTIIPIVILTFGIVGNAINTLIFAKKSMRSSPTLRFLLYLSMADLIVLIMGMSEILLKSDFSFGLRDSSLFVCNIQKFISYSSTYISSLLSVSLNVYRAKLISYVSYRHRKMNKKRVRFKRTPYQRNSFIDCLTKFIIIFVFILNSHFIFLLKPSYIVSFDDLNNVQKLAKSQNETKQKQVPFQFRKHPRPLLDSFYANMLAAQRKSQTVTVFRNRLNTFDTVAYSWMTRSATVIDGGRRLQRLWAVTTTTTSTTTNTPENVTSKANLKENDYFYDVFKCLPKRNSFYEYFLIRAWIWIDICLFSLIPFISMTLCSIIIIVNLMRLNKIYSSRLALNTNTLTKSIYKRKLRNNVQISFMLIGSNVYFLITMCIFWIWFSILGNKNRSETFGTNVKQSFVYTLLYSNNAFGILFYSLFSTQYRKEIVRLYVCKFLCKRCGPSGKNKTTPT